MGAPLAVFVRGPICVFNAGRDLFAFSWHYFFFFAGRFFAVFSLSLKALSVGAPLAPFLRIRSPLPAFILARFLAIFL